MPSDSDSDEPQGWKDIKFISYFFEEHCDTVQYPSIHKAMNSILGSRIKRKDIDDLFETPERITFKKNAVEILRNKCIACIKEEAKLTTKPARIETIMRDLSMNKNIDGAMTMVNIRIKVSDDLEEVFDIT